MKTQNELTWIRLESTWDSVQKVSSTHKETDDARGEETCGKFFMIFAIGIVQI